ncbi:hypothetical protein RCL1_003445 [Eukaryota sp. TZLM3-RCL]
MLSKLITEDDILSHTWQDSDTYKDIVFFLETLGNSVVGVKRTHIKPSESCEKLLKILSSIRSFNSQITITETSNGRFGLVVFRQFLTLLQDNASSFISNAFDLPSEIVTELAEYLFNSFGDYKRIDYGTGHELNFIAFLLALSKVGILTPEDLPSLVLYVIYDYLDLCFFNEDQYRLEPAGSRGVFAFDDFHVVGFLLGAFQMRNNEDELVPRQSTDAHLCSLLKDDYLLMFSFNRIIVKKYNVDCHGRKLLME